MHSPPLVLMYVMSTVFWGLISVYGLLGPTTDFSMSVNGTFHTLLENTERFKIRSVSLSQSL